MTCPPSAFVKMLLVVDTLSESLNIVVTNSNAGKIEKSNGDFVFIAINSIVIAIVILIMSSKSINIIGSGTINISTMPIIPPIMLASEPPKPKSAVMAVKVPMLNFTIDPKKTTIDDMILSILLRRNHVTPTIITYLIGKKVQKLGGIS